MSRKQDALARPRFIRVSTYPIYTLVPDWPVIAKNDLGQYATAYRGALVVATWLAYRVHHAPNSGLVWLPWIGYVKVPRSEEKGALRVTLLRSRRGPISAQRFHQEISTRAHISSVGDVISIVDRSLSADRLNRWLWRLDELVDDFLMQEAL